MTKKSRRTSALPSFLSEADIQRLLSLSCLHGRDKAILEVLIATGLRASELLALNAGHVNVDCLLVRQGKGGKSRYVPLSQRAYDAIEVPLSQCSSAVCPVFTNVWGDRLSRRGLSKIVAAYFKAAGLKGSLHTCRHAAATRWLNHGIGLRSVQAMLGHADISTTAIYLGVATDALVAEYKRCLPE